jgi:tripeptidyl-peptidase-1
MLFKSLFQVLALAASVEALTIPNSHVVHEKRDSAPRAWVKRGVISSRTTLPMRIGLKQRDLHLGEEFLLDV